MSKLYKFTVLICLIAFGLSVLNLFYATIYVAAAVAIFGCLAAVLSLIYYFVDGKRLSTLPMVIMWALFAIVSTAGFCKKFL